MTNRRRRFVKDQDFPDTKTPGFVKQWDFKKKDLLDDYKSKVGVDKLEELIQMICEEEGMIYEAEKVTSKNGKSVRVSRISLKVQPALFE